MTNNLENPCLFIGFKLPPEETESLLREVREQLASSNFNLQDEGKLKQMVESLGDTRGMVRLGFADALGKVGKAAVPFLVEALKSHPNVVVKRAAAKTLTLIGDTTTVPNLIYSLLNDEDTVVKTSCVGALARMGEAAVPDLLKIIALGEYSESINGQAAWALAFIGAEAKEILIPHIRSDSGAVRTAVVGALAKAVEDNPDEVVLNILLNALKDPDPMVRVEAASVLGNLAYKPAFSFLLELLNYADGDTRKAAAFALMKMGDRTAVDLLSLALSKESEGGVELALKLAISRLENYSN